MERGPVAHRIVHSLLTEYGDFVFLQLKGKFQRAPFCCGRSGENGKCLVGFPPYVLHLLQVGEVGMFCHLGDGHMAALLGL